MTESLLPALLIVAPILGATVSLALGVVRERTGWTVAALVLAVEAALASWLAYAVYYGRDHADGIRHVLGGETFGRKDVVIGVGPSAGQRTENFIVGIELVADEFSGLVVMLVAVVALAVLAFSRQAGPRGNAFYSGYLLLTGGLMGVALTGDLFNLFVFLEIVGLATYALIASGESGESAVAALKYLIIGTTGASMYLIGVGYLFVRTGALNMVDVARSLAGEPSWIEGALYGDPLVAAAFGFIAAGLAAKAAIYPLHTWQPDAYAAAPDAVTVYISALASTSAAYALARVTWTVFRPAFFEVHVLMLNGLLVLAALGVLVGSFVAGMQRRIKRTFAYSSVAQFGLIVLGIGIAVHPSSTEAATTFAVYGVAIHLVAHGLIKGGLFATAGAFARAADARTVSDYAGLAKKHPLLAGSFAVLGFSIVGVPPTVGFIGKWYLAVASVESGLWPVVLVVFASTLLTLLYVAQLLEKLYFDYLPEDEPVHAQASAAVATDGGRRLPLGILALAVGAAVLSLALGFAGGELTELVDPVARRLFEDPEVILND